MLTVLPYVWCNVEKPCLVPKAVQRKGFLCFPGQRAPWKGSRLNESKNQFSEKRAPAICHLQTCYYFSELAVRAGWRLRQKYRPEPTCLSLSLLFSVVSCPHHSPFFVGFFLTHNTHAICINSSIYSHACHAGHVLYFSPSACAREAFLS